MKIMNKILMTTFILLMLVSTAFAIYAPGGLLTQDTLDPTAAHAVPTSYAVAQYIASGILSVRGDVFYVENNAGLDTNDGSTWALAFKTLSAAVTASNASIADADMTGYAARNTIFVKADALLEDLTVFPAKCDVVGAGSCDAMNKTRIIGEHCEAGDGVIQSTGWYNLEFRNDDADAIFTVTTYSGLYFGDCIFTADADSVNAILTSGSCDNFTIKDCWFRNDEDGNDPFATAAISLVGAVYNVLIEDNFIEGEIGINIDNAVAYNVVINKNVIKAVGVVIDDESDLAVVTNNRLISAGDNSTETTVMDIAVGRAAGNILTGSTDTQNYPVLIGDS